MFAYVITCDIDNNVLKGLMCKQFGGNMLSDKDRAVVASMVRTGMSLETLKLSFPGFETVDLVNVYEEEHSRISEETVDEIEISCNCS